jgi:hypothetical protein
MDVLDPEPETECLDAVADRITDMNTKQSITGRAQA